MPGRLALFGSLLAVAATLAGCGANSLHPANTGSSSLEGPAPPAGSIKLEVGQVSGLGNVVVNAAGRTLYVFAPDGGQKVTCNESCQSVWPPEVAPASGKAIAGPGLKASLVGSDRNPLGGRVVTYAGWPLYTFDNDQAPGQAQGQALDLSGGYWFVIRPSGQVVRSR